MSNESATLLPCPFCGGEANAYVMAGDAVVECTACNAELAQSVEDEDYHDTSAIIARWNSRSKPVASGVEVKPLEWKDGWGCSTAKSCVGVYQVKSRPSDSAVDVTLANGASVWSTWASVTEKGKAAAEADYRNRILSALLPKATAPVVSEPVAKPYAFEFGKSNGDGTYCVVIERVGEGYVEQFAVKDWPIKPLYASPQPGAAITEEMVERAYEAFVAACEWPDWDEPEVRGYLRTALTAALKEA